MLGGRTHKWYRFEYLQPLRPCEEIIIRLQEKTILEI